LYGGETPPGEDGYWRTFVGLEAVGGTRMILADMYEVTDLFPADKDYIGIGAELNARINRVARCGGKTIFEVYVSRRMSGSGSFTNSADFWFELQETGKLKLLATQLDLDTYGRSGWAYVSSSTSTITSVSGTDVCAFEIVTSVTEIVEDIPRKKKPKRIFLQLSDGASKPEQLETFPARPADARVLKIPRSFR
jgi:hypothetical protein